MRSMEEMLKLACSYLNDCGAEYVVVGGIAVIAYGEPRSTADADIIIQMEIDGMRDFADYLGKNGFFSKPEDIEDAVRERSHFFALDKDSLFRLDIKGVYGGMDSRTLANKREKDYNGTKIYLASPEDTIANKLVFNSEQDIRDAESIYARQLPTLDLPYLEKISRDMGVANELADMRLRVDKCIGELEGAPGYARAERKRC